MRKPLALVLCAALSLVSARFACAVSLDVDAPISYTEAQIQDGGGGPTLTTSVSVSWADASALSYEWTNTGDGWKWVPSSVEVIFTVANNSVCNEATVSAAFLDLSYGGKTAADFALEGAAIGLSSARGGALAGYASTGPLSSVCGNDGDKVGVSEIGVGHLYYAIRPAEGAGLTHEQTGALGPAAVSAAITFEVAMDSSAHENCTSGAGE